MEAFFTSSSGTVLALFLFFSLLGFILPKKRVFRHEFKVKTTKKKLWKLLTKIEHFPQWQPTLRRVDVLHKVDAKVTQWNEIPYRGKIVHYKKLSETKYQYLSYAINSGQIYSGRSEIQIQNQGKEVRVKLATSIIIKNPVLRVISYLKLNIKGNMKLWQKHLQAYLLLSAFSLNFLYFGQQLGNWHLI